MQLPDKAQKGEITALDKFLVTHGHSDTSMKN
jgi:phosphoribosyl 1,2-cyclic phosphodiesterase